MQAEQFARELARIASELKSEDVVLLDLRGLTSITDFLVIATGTSDRQMHAVIDHLREYAQRVGEKTYGLDGEDSDRWILVDFVDVVVHLFSREARDFYDMELLWGDAPRIAWARSETA
ncbi:MAG: ribosomal silencing factor RsfS [Phycisphaerae bacterium]